MDPASGTRELDALVDSEYFPDMVMLKGLEESHVVTVPYYFYGFPLAVSRPFMHTFSHVTLPKLPRSVNSL